jgi:hypothetical protein
MASDLPRFTLRIPVDLLDKIGLIAEENGRSTNREIEILVKKHVSDYEKEHGEIVLDTNGSSLLAAHREDDPMKDLPSESLQQIEDLKQKRLKKFRKN